MMTKYYKCTIFDMITRSQEQFQFILGELLSGSCTTEQEEHVKLKEWKHKHAAELRQAVKNRLHIPAAL